jgi:hypothetical protein
MLAVLEDAVRTVTTCERTYGDRIRRRVREAEAWFAADDREWPFSFLNICQAIGVEPDRVRAWLARQASRHPVSRDAAARPGTGARSSARRRT